MLTASPMSVNSRSSGPLTSPATLKPGVDADVDVERRRQLRRSVVLADPVAASRSRRSPRRAARPRARSARRTRRGCSRRGTCRPSPRASTATSCRTCRQPLTARYASAGGSCSDMRVKPVMSAKSTVTRRRSASLPRSTVAASCASSVSIAPARSAPRISRDGIPGGAALDALAHGRASASWSPRHGVDERGRVGGGERRERDRRRGSARRRAGARAAGLVGPHRQQPEHRRSRQAPPRAARSDRTTPGRPIAVLADDDERPTRRRASRSRLRAHVRSTATASARGVAGERPRERLDVEAGDGAGRDSERGPRSTAGSSPAPTPRPSASRSTARCSGASAFPDAARCRRARTTPSAAASRQSLGDEPRLAHALGAGQQHHPGLAGARRRRVAPGAPPARRSRPTRRVSTKPGCAPGRVRPRRAAGTTRKASTCFCLPRKTSGGSVDQLELLARAPRRSRRRCGSAPARRGP